MAHMGGLLVQMVVWAPGAFFFSGLTYGFSHVPLQRLPSSTSRSALAQGSWRENVTLTSHQLPHRVSGLHAGMTVDNLDWQRSSSSSQEKLDSNECVIPKTGI